MVLVDFVIVCRIVRVLYYRGSKKDPDAPAMPTVRGRKRAATVTGPQPQHLPQRVFLIASVNALGATGPEILLKPIQGLGKDYIVAIHFRNISHTPSTSSQDQQAQLWLYDPQLVSEEQRWFKYFTEILAPLVQRVRSHLMIEPPLAPVVPPEPPQFPIGSLVLVVPAGRKKKNAELMGPFTVVHVAKQKRINMYTMIDLLMQL